jgi:integrase
LYLEISPTGQKRWVLRYSRSGKVTEKSLGSVKFVTLDEARNTAFQFHRSVATGAAPPPEWITFGVYAELFIKMREDVWDPKTVASRRAMLRNHAASLNKLGVAEIDNMAVFRVLQPIWTKIPTRANQLRALIEQILDAAKVKGMRSGENPARLKGNLAHVLPKRRRGSHNEALPWAQVPELMQRLAAEPGIVTRALRFTILCALRKGETYGLKWSDVDLEARVVVIPAERMKGGRMHRVPLSSAALTVLEEQRQLSGTVEQELVFPSPYRTSRSSGPLNAGAFNDLLTRLGVEVTPHGFRSSFKDWASECTDHPNEVSEAALAHVNGDATERAYRRGDLFDKRRLLMEQWGAFATGADADFVAARSSRGPWSRSRLQTGE